MRVLFLLLCVVSPVLAADPSKNPRIDAEGFQAIVKEALKERVHRRLSEEEFLRAMADQKTVLLDARSTQFYEMRRLKGAVNLPLTEFTEETLAKVIPSKETRVLIYCNNNFRGSVVSFPTKAITASLNLSTYPALWAYGYQNVYELGPNVHVDETALPFEGTEVTGKARAGNGSAR